MISSFLSGATNFFSFCLVITLIVSVHEMGHYMVARLCNIHVESFSLGFGPEIVGYTSKKKTRWKISLFLVGGYVKMREKKASRDIGIKDNFCEKSAAQKIAVTCAGPVANFLLAICIFAGFFKIYGVYETPPIVAKVVKGSVAESVGLLEGDIIKEIDGKTIISFEAIRSIVASSFEKKITVEYERKNTRAKIEVIPSRIEIKDNSGKNIPIGQLGIIPVEGEMISLSFGKSLHHAVEKTFFLSKEMVNSIKEIIQGKRDHEELGGPIRIASYSKQSLEKGMASFLWFNALLSINLGVMNLIPLPLLDGGHIILHLIEAIRRKALSEKTIMRWTQIGIALVLFLMIHVTWNDLHFFLGQ